MYVLGSPLNHLVIVCFCLIIILILQEINHFLIGSGPRDKRQSLEGLKQLRLQLADNKEELALIVAQCSGNYGNGWHGNFQFSTEFLSKKNSLSSCNFISFSAHFQGYLRGRVILLMSANFSAEKFKQIILSNSSI